MKRVSISGDMSPRSANTKYCHICKGAIPTEVNEGLMIGTTQAQEEIERSVHYECYLKYKRKLMPLK